MSWLAVAGWLLSSPVTVALALVTAAVRPHLIQLVSSGSCVCRKHVPPPLTDFVPV